MYKILMLVLSYLLFPVVIQAEFHQLYLTPFAYSVETKSKTARLTGVNRDTFKSITELVIPSTICDTRNGMVFTVKVIESEVLPYNNPITSVTIPNTVEQIEKNAFSGCMSLKSMIIPNSVATIGNQAFECCTELKHVSISGPINKISDWLFRDCSSLGSIAIPNTVKSINEYAFLRCSSLEEVYFPESLESIGLGAFQDCKKLNGVTIPNKVRSIKKYAFDGCKNLKTLIIGKSVQNIYEKAFANCTELADVYCLGATPPTIEAADVFNGSYIEYATLHVPAASLDLYKNDTRWGAFGTIVAMADNESSIAKCATPEISYNDGKLTFKSATEGAFCLSSITNDDANSYTGSEVGLGVTYKVSAYASKGGYRNSDVATAILCWADKNPKMEEAVNNVMQIPAKAMLIQAYGNEFSIAGADEGTPIQIFDDEGMACGSATASTGVTLVSTSIEKGHKATVQIGKRSVKLMMR